jgi:hypothetical protein
MGCLEENLIECTEAMLEKPALSTHAAQFEHELLVKRRQTQPGDAIADRRLETYGSVTGVYMATNALRVSARDSRQGVGTHI